MSAAAAARLDVWRSMSYRVCGHEVTLIFTIPSYTALFAFAGS